MLKGSLAKEPQQTITTVKRAAIVFTYVNGNIYQVDMTAN